MGAAFGTAKAGLGIVETAAERPDLIFRSIIPVVMAGILGMYGMIIAIIMKGSSKFFCYWHVRSFPYNSILFFFCVNSPRDSTYRFRRSYKMAVHLLRRVQATWRWTERRTFRFGFGFGHRCHGKCWSEGHQAQWHPHRRHSTHDLRWGYRTLRIHCGHRPRVSMNVSIKANMLHRSYLHFSDYWVNFTKIRSKYFTSKFGRVYIYPISQNFLQALSLSCPPFINSFSWFI